MTKPAYASGAYLAARRDVLARGAVCAHCGAPATEADHVPPLGLHQHVAGTGCCALQPSCFTCGRLQGGQLATALAAGRPAPVDGDTLVEPAGFDEHHPVWQAAPWIAALLPVPADATWPRLMTVPHPRAVGSLGAEVAEWVRERRRRPWRWWQRLAATRLLEVDAAGRLVWETAILTVARQVGKSWLLGDVCGWRLESGDRFGGEQLVLSTGKDVAVVREVQRPFRVRAKAIGDPYKVREVNAQEEIEFLPDASRWMVRSKDGVYGLPASMATVDEAWKVTAAVVDDGLVPTMVERDQSQLLLVSTAHRRATALMIGRRATALECLADPGDDGPLLLEWSAPNGDLEDRHGWRQASPHWTAKRERWIAARLAAALGGEGADADEPDPVESFRSQWLNVWPAKRMATPKGEALVEPVAWRAACCETDSEGPLVIGVEDHFGQGAAVGFCGTLPDGRLVIGGLLRASRADAYVTARAAATSRPGSVLVAGASLAADAELADMPVREVKRAGAAETGPSLATLRDQLATGQVTHDGSPGLTDQVLHARVKVGASGLALASGGRADLLRAAVWALRVAVTQPVAMPAIH